MGLGSLIGLVGLTIAGTDLTSAAFITAVSPGPAILLGSLCAAQLARIAARAKPAWDAQDWIRRGTVFGAAGGATFLTLWVVAFNLPAGGPPFSVVALTLATGAISGGVIGLVVGWYCSRVVRVATAPNA